MMKKQLFFDDKNLFGRDNVIRSYGQPELIATYKDGVSSPDHCSGFIFRLENGTYRMLYFAHGATFADLKLFAAISDDGIHFSPEKINHTAENQAKSFPHEVMTLQSGWEIATIYEDIYCDSPEEKYKLLMAELDWDQLCVNDTIYVSPDLLNWRLKEGARWGNGAEPLASVFYNKEKQVHTIIQRPFWGIRSVGYKETKDWNSFSEYRQCLNVDDNDERLAEIYGMYAFEYDGMYIGLPHMYRHLESELNAKYKNGIIDTQLAYSYDGRYWQRGKRLPFISGSSTATQGEGKNHPLTWVTTMRKGADGNLYFYGSASELEHGPAFHQPGTGKILIHRLRTDGFVSLSTENVKKPSSIATREKVWHSGELHCNLKAEKATLAVYISDESEFVSGNALGVARPLEGFSHDDCIPFSGDTTDWVPTYRSGKQLGNLCGKTLVFELRFENGEVFSISGDYTDVYNTQAARYRKYGVLPK